MWLDLTYNGFFRCKGEKIKIPLDVRHKFLDIKGIFILLLFENNKKKTLLPLQSI
jgi:hypothetical protein